MGRRLKGLLTLGAVALTGCADPAANYSMAKAACSSEYPPAKGSLEAYVRCLDVPFRRLAQADGLSITAQQAYMTLRHAAARQVDSGEIPLAEFEAQMNSDAQTLRALDAGNIPAERVTAVVTNPSYHPVDESKLVEAAVPPEVTEALTKQESPVSPGRKSVAMRQQGGVYVVPVSINNALTLDFVLDSGAADVSIPADVVLTLIRTGTLRRTDFLGAKTYELADGSQIPSETFRIRSLKIGDEVIENVIGSVAGIRGSLLLGQSFLSRFKAWSIDNTKHAFVFH